MNWEEDLKKSLKGRSTGMLIAAIVTIIIGIFLIINPAVSLRAILWILVIGMVIAGISSIVAYSKMSYWIRQGYSLVTGIVELVCAVLLLACLIAAPNMTDELFAIFIGFMFAFCMMFAGISTLSGASVTRRLGGSVGWVVFGGVLEIIAAIMLLFAPQFGTYFLMIMLGITLIIVGIDLLALTIDLRNRAKAFVDYANKNDSFDPTNDPFINWMH